MTTPPPADALDQLRTGAHLAPPDALAVLRYVGDLEHTSRTLDTLLDALLEETAPTVDTSTIAEILNAMPTTYRDDAHAARVAFRLATFVLFECDGSLHDARDVLMLWNERAGAPLDRPRLDAIRAQARLFGGPRPAPFGYGPTSLQEAA